MIELNHDKRLENIQKELKAIRDALDNQNEKQERNFFLSLGMAIIAIGLSVLFAGMALSRIDYTTFGSIIVSVGLALMFCSKRSPEGKKRCKI